MATLEKIRSKSVLLIVVIGVALLAFIIGDAITNSRNLFGDQTTVAKIGGTKIDYTDYMKKREELNQRVETQRKQNPNYNPNSEALVQQALEELISEQLLDKAVEKAGIEVSPALLSYYVIENPVNPKIGEIIQSLQAAGYSNVNTPAQANEIIFYPQRNGVTEAEMKPFQQYWLAMENETRQMIKRYNYQTLLAGTVRANELDKKKLYEDYVNKRKVEVAYKPYSDVSNDKYAPSEKEIKAEYENAKGDYKVEELTKEVAFIAVSIAPSDADQEASKALAAKTVAALQTGDAETNKEIKKEGVVITHRELREQDIQNRAVKEFLANAPADSVGIITDNIQGFTVVKAGNKSMEVDQVKLNLVSVIRPDLVESTLASLNAGVALDSISNDSTIFVQKDESLNLFTAQGPAQLPVGLERAKLDSLIAGGSKFMELMSGPQGAMIAQVAEKNEPVAVYTFDEVKYELKPSLTTINDSRIKLEDFLAANESSKLFVENAPKEGYNIHNVDLTASTPAVPRGNGFYPDSRQVVRWVIMDGKPGQVSHVYESNDALNPALYAVAVVDEYEDYMPLTNDKVKSAIEDRVRKSKAGDEIVAQVKPQATTMANAAAALGSEVRSNDSFRFSRNALVADQKVTGQISGDKPGKVVVVKGDNGVYVYQILSEEVENFPYNDEQYENQYMTAIGMNNPKAMYEMLKGADKLKNNIYKFEAGD